MSIKTKSLINLKKILSLFFCITLTISTLSACNDNETKSKNKSKNLLEESNAESILGKWYNEKGDCLEILSDNTYSIDNIYDGYESGINSGKWSYLEVEDFFKFYADNYDESIIKVEVNKDKYGTFIKYSYYGTFYKGKFPSNLIDEQYIKCPDFVGLTIEELKEHKYYKDNLLNFEFEYIESDNDINRVCDQSIAAGKKTKKGSTITIYISKELTMVKVPDFVGLTLENVEKHEYYKENIFEFMFNYIESEYDINRVCDQSIPAGKKLKKGTTITLYISTGQITVAIPDVFNMNEDKAISTLKAEGFIVETKKQKHEEVEAGKVIRTDPAIGTKVPDKSKITVYVSSGKADN